MENHFPTLGEIAHYLFLAAGVLPSKGDKDNILSETEKKTFQRKLGRLSKEACNLDSALGEVLEILWDYIDTVFPEQKVTLAMSETVFDALNQYQDLVRGDGSHLNKIETIRWVLLNRLPHRAVLSSRKNRLRFRINSLNICSPEDKYWFLPSIVEGEIHWPLAKVMRWIYKYMGTTQTHFHFPGCSAGNSNPRLEQNLENASRWINGHQFPGWSNLKMNLEASIEALSVCPDSTYRKEVCEQDQKNIKLISFISRFTTFVFKSVEENYGREFLVTLIERYKKYDRLFDDVEENIIDCVNGIKSNLPASNFSLNEDQLWLEMVRRYFKRRAIDVHQMGQLMQEIHEAEIVQKRQILSRKEVRQFFSNKFGPFFTVSGFDEIDQADQEKFCDIDFMKVVHEGMSLRQKSDLTESEISCYEDKLERLSLTKALPWLVPWMRATLLYRKEQYADAFELYKEAFEKGRYSAGKHQYKLVNQYIEACAKVDNFKAFKRGVSWANYLGIKVRWLRGFDEPDSEESLRTAFLIFKQARYPQL